MRLVCKVLESQEALAHLRMQWSVEVIFMMILFFFFAFSFSFSFGLCSFFLN